MRRGSKVIVPASHDAVKQIDGLGEKPGILGQIVEGQVHDGVPGAAATAEKQVTVPESGIETDTLKVTFDEKMHITSLHSKTAGRETLPEGIMDDRLIAYDDVTKGNNWNAQAYYHEKYHVIDDVTDVRVLEVGPSGV